MNTQNQINLVIQYMNVNTTDRVGFIRINQHGTAFVYCRFAPNPTYYTIYSIFTDEQIDAFTDAQIEDCISLGENKALEMMASVVGDLSSN